jgi:hypothetical protein
VLHACRARTGSSVTLIFRASVLLPVCTTQAWLGAMKSFRSPIFTALENILQAADAQYVQAVSMSRFMHVWDETAAILKQ